MLTSAINLSYTQGYIVSSDEWSLFYVLLEQYAGLFRQRRKEKLQTNCFVIE